MSRVYKILPAAVWEDARAAGRFEGSEVDLGDGFIHLSGPDQVRETARLHFAGQNGLVLLEFEADELGAALRWEPSRGGQLFPHLYAPLDPGCVRACRPLALNAAGWPDPGEDGRPTAGDGL